ncbi:hypothetical protein C8D88_1011853 [Lentzea atacamensis]|uniref:Uncharacterized protein n=2 Tax=Lentzea TaxID=165301 RepID=A0A316IHB5_9PSEU|nr:hypothetical protein [Lentzea atacamensis]PWK91814.1 hypothetical protein C8D88_1011853 [Lentzea atacamensis]RAS63632.1 hypothetical protein C8D87_10633 [Lentzea atacamensis]
MHNAQSDSQPDAPRTTEFDGLFSHPDQDHGGATSGPAPAEDQRSYTGLFREPAGGTEDATSAA